MASKRMFAYSVVCSGRFLKMPVSSRLLYYDLGMRADDAGIVEAFSVMMQTGASQDDLQILAAKGFIVILNEDFVSYICDWHTNNKISPTKYQESRYQHLLVKMLGETRSCM